MTASDGCASSTTSIPTVVFSATGADGHDVIGARVTLDGQGAAERVTGEAIALDPGEHVASCEADGLPRVEVRFVATQGEKNRAVHFTFGPDGRTATAAAESATYARPIPTADLCPRRAGHREPRRLGRGGSVRVLGGPERRDSRPMQTELRPGRSAGRRAKADRRRRSRSNGAARPGGRVVLYLTRPSVVVAPVRAGAVGAWSIRF